MRALTPLFFSRDRESLPSRSRLLSLHTDTSLSRSVYFQMPKDTSGFFSRGGIIFFAILVRYPSSPSRLPCSVPC